MRAPSSQSRSYIAQFDALRFFAALLTALFHGQVFKFFFKAPDITDGYLQSQLGSHCVTFFFVLSGFLITWLLFREQDKTGSVDVKAFYLRRVFRIWPLYYTILVLGLIVAPALPIALPGAVGWGIRKLDAWQLLAWFTFFPNVQKAGLIPLQLLISHTWSIGMEEQFYGVWPWLVRRMRHPITAFLGVVGVFLVLRFVAYPVSGSNVNLMLWVTAFRFDCMALGGVVAWLYYYQAAAPWVQIFRSPIVLYSSFVGMGLLTLKPDLWAEMYFTPFLAMGYGIALLSLALQQNRMTWLNAPRLRYLGQVSYGIYMYNPLGCVLAMNVILILPGGINQFSEATWLTNITYYSLCAFITILLSIISYRYLETPFLRMKDRLGTPKPLQSA